MRALAMRDTRRDRLWANVLLAAKIVLIPAFVFAIAGALAYVRLLQGPVSLPFLVEPIQNALKEELQGVNLKIGEVAVRLAERSGLEFELKHIRISNEQDETLALTPSATISLSRSALFAGRLAPESVALIQPRLLLFYGDDGNLSLKFSHPGEQPLEPLQPPRGTQRPATQQTAAPATLPNDAGIGRIDLVKVLTESSGRARRREAATAYLREIGLKSATLIVDSAGRRSVWRIADLAIDLDHRRSQSSVAGRAKIESLAGPWSLNFRTIENAASSSLQLAVSVQGLVPRGLARSVPALAFLESFDLPLWGEAKVDLSSSGEVLGGFVALDAAPGELRIPWLGSGPLKVDGAHLHVSYDSKQKRFEIAPSVLVWGDSRVQFTGTMQHTANGGDGPVWTYALRSAGGWLAAEPPATQRTKIDDWSAIGTLSTERSRIDLKQFRLRAGGADVAAEGDITGLGGDTKARLEGKLGPMTSTQFKALWPSGLATQSRSWVMRNLVRGQLQRGNFRFLQGHANERSADGDRASLTLEAADVGLRLLDNWPLLEVPRALVRVDGDSFEFAVPDGFVSSGDGRKLAVKGSLNIDLKEPLPRNGQIALRTQGPLSLVNELFDRPPFRAAGEAALISEKLDGRIDGQVTLTLPLIEDLKAGDLRGEGRIKILDGRMKVGVGNYEVTSANITIDVAHTSAEAKGELLVNGVVAKVGWQHVFGAPPDKQPPLRITSVLDDSYRNQLGLDINDLVRGDVAVEVTVARAETADGVRVRADLLNADLSLDSVAWVKPRGRGAIFEFDYAKGSGALPIELRNVKLVGENVALEGAIGVGADHKVREFRFPTFSLNVVTSLEVSGRLRSDGIWDVTAKGPTFDGRDLFRSFFDVASHADTGKAKPGFNLRAEIGTVIGHFDTNLRNMRATFQKRGHKVSVLDVRGNLEGGKLFGAVIRHEPNQPRRLLAEATDAGQLFKLVGFYPNAVGGVMNLEVNLDGQGLAERTGTLWVRDFVVLGDPIISEVLQNADGSTSTGSRRKVVREQFEFERLRIPFSVGHGQFVMHSGYINGPLLGATMRGKVDFRARELNVGGTYVPLSGLNRALAPIPLLGPLLTGPRGEGVLGITFAIQGPMNNPQVLVNPLSLVTPGIFREIMQMTPEDPKVLPRANPQRRPGSGPRASSSEPTGVERPADTEAPRGEIGGGWSAETENAKPPRRR